MISILAGGFLLVYTDLSLKVLVVFVGIWLIAGRADRDGRRVPAPLRAGDVMVKSPEPTPATTPSPPSRSPTDPEPTVEVEVQPDPSTEAELAALRAEVARLQSEAQVQPDAQPVAPAGGDRSSAAC